MIAAVRAIVQAITAPFGFFWKTPAGQGVVTVDRTDITCDQTDITCDQT